MNRVLALAAVAMLTAAPAAAVRAQGAPAPQSATPQTPAPKTYDMRDATPRDMEVWIKDPNFHAFYQATIDAFAHGPDHLDRAAYEKRSHEIFRALAVAHNMPPEALQDHLKAIPGEMVQIVTRDPQTLASYDNFTVALFGPH